MEHLYSTISDNCKNNNNYYNITKYDNLYINYDHSSDHLSRTESY